MSQSSSLFFSSSSSISSSSSSSSSSKQTEDAITSKRKTVDYDNNEEDELQSFDRKQKPKQNLVSFLFNIVDMGMCTTLLRYLEVTEVIYFATTCSYLYHAPSRLQYVLPLSLDEKGRANAPTYYQDDDSVVAFNWKIDMLRISNPLPDDTSIAHLFRIGNKQLTDTKSITFIKKLLVQCSLDNNINISFFPPNLYELDLLSSYKPIPNGIFPATLKVLTIRSLCQPIERNTLPSHLHTFHVFSYYTYSLKQDVLPASLRRMTFSISSSTLDLNAFPQHMKHLDLTIRPTVSVSGTLPSHLCILKVHNNSTFRHLCSPGMLPSSLRELQISAVDTIVAIPPNVLPEGLHTLYFDAKVTFPLDRTILPTTLKCLAMEQYSPLLTNETLPTQLESLSIYKCKQPLQPYVLPPALQLLEIGFDSESFFLSPLTFPDSLLVLRLTAAFHLVLDRTILPPHLHVLELICSCDSTLTQQRLPESLTYLCIKHIHNRTYTVQHDSYVENLRVVSLNTKINVVISSLYSCIDWEGVVDEEIKAEEANEETAKWQETDDIDIE